MADPTSNHPPTESPHDARLYVPAPDGWEAHIKRDSLKDYCYFQNPGEDYFHLLLAGEIFLQRGYERCCLNCALRHGFITSDRLFWQHGGSERKSLPL
jgi:hypothetical protein